MLDAELLALPKIGPQEAARYLQNGTSAQEMRVKAQNGVCPFCVAEKMTGRYRYRILVGALIKYKAGELTKESGNHKTGKSIEYNHREGAASQYRDPAGLLSRRGPEV